MRRPRAVPDQRDHGDRPPAGRRGGAPRHAAASPVRILPAARGAALARPVGGDRQRPPQPPPRRSGRGDLERRDVARQRHGPGARGAAYPTDDTAADSGARAGARGRFARQLAGRPPGKAGPRRARTGTTTPAWGRRRGNPDGPLGVRTMTTKIPRGPRERLLSRLLRSCGASAPTAGVVPCPSAASSLCTGPPYVAPSDARIALRDFTVALGGVRYFPRGRGRYIGRQADDWTPRYHGQGGGGAGYQRRGRAGPHKARHHRARA